MTNEEQNPESKNGQLVNHNHGKCSSKASHGHKSEDNGAGMFFLRMWSTYRKLRDKAAFYMVAGNTPSDFSHLAQIKARDLTLLSLPPGTKSTRAGGDFHLQLYRIQSS